MVRAIRVPIPARDGELSVARIDGYVVSNKKSKGTPSRFPGKVNRLGLSPFPMRQIPSSSKLDVELGMADSKMVNKKIIVRLKATRLDSTWICLSARKRFAELQ